MQIHEEFGSAMLATAQPGLAGRAAQLLAQVGTPAVRQIPPELAGIPNTLTVPNAEQPMSGEFANGRLVDNGDPAYHSLDRLVPITQVIEHLSSGGLRSPVGERR